MKGHGERARRTRPEREGPVRNRLMTTGKIDGALADEHRESRRETPQSDVRPVDAVREALECGIRTAYTVIDDYMRRGYEAARENANNPPERGFMRDDKQTYGQTYGPWNNPWGAMMAPMQQWMNVMRAWADAWAPFLPPGWSQQMWNSPMPGYGPPMAPPVVSLHVSSQRPADVTAKVHLHPGCAYSGLRVNPLEGQSGKPPIKGVSLSGDNGVLHVHLPVTADQPAGAYQGDIVYHDGRPAGKLSVVIADLPGKPA